MKITFTAIAILVLALCLACAPVHSRRTMNRCQLAREMDSLGVSRSELARWACIAERESEYRTWVVGPPNTDGSQDHGIFQINDRYWCKPSDGRQSYNGCNINCDELRTDNIAKAVKCAQKVKNQQGFEAWSTWKYCNGYLPSIDDCFDNLASGMHCFGFK